ncbi:hypothetical protein BDN72DRAFT_964605, partial [Pluteus cervinus]
MSRILLFSCGYTAYGRRAQERVDLLCTVCEAWKSIIQATPRFYSDYLLQIQNDRRIDEKLDKIVLRAQIWLSRSGGLPIDLWIHIPQRLRSLRLASLLQPIFTSVSTRIRFLSLKCNHIELWKLWDVLPPLPMLQELSVDRTGPRDVDVAERPFPEAVNLITVVL